MCGKRVRSFIATFGCGVRLAYFFLSPDEAIPGLSYPDTAPARAHRPLFRPLSFPVGGSLHVSSCLQFGSQLDASCCIHVQELDGGSPSRREADDAWAAKSEVVLPGILPRVEQWNDCSSLRIDAREVRPLVEVAAITG